MKFIKSLIAVSTISLSLLFSVASDAAPTNGKTADDSKIKQKMLSLGLMATKIEDAPIKGLKQIYTNRGVFYMSDDAQFFIAGRLFDIDNNMTNLTETALSSLRLDGMKEFQESMIIFPAKDEKAQITVFTDTTCGYCRKLHAQIDEYNDLGITVNYLAFPRGGMNSKSFDDISAVWCSADQKKAMTDAKSGSSVAQARCDAPIAGHYNLGQAAGVTGTPAIVLDDGTMIPGYKPPSDLAKILNL